MAAGGFGQSGGMLSVSIGGTGSLEHSQLVTPGAITLGGTPEHNTGAALGICRRPGTARTSFRKLAAAR